MDGAAHFAPARRAPKTGTVPVFTGPAIFGAVLLLAAVPAFAEDVARKTNDVLSSVAGIAQNLELADVPSPINITADRLEFLYGQGLLRYQGNVSVDHAGAKIHAQSLEVSFEPEGKRSLIVDLADNHARHVWLQQEGAYHLGLAVGRRLRGRPAHT